MSIQSPTDRGEFVSWAAALADLASSVGLAPWVGVKGALAKDAIARVKLLVRVPFGFHGSWVDNAE